MAAFCGKCGAPLQDGVAFCTACGAPTVSQAQVAAVQPRPVVVEPRVVQAHPPAPSGSGVKIVLIVLCILGLGAVLVVGGVAYMVHRTVVRVKQAAAAAGFSESDLHSAVSGSREHVDACKYLSAGDVSAAVGVPIIAAKSDDSGCHYIAQGAASVFTAGHLSAMMGGKTIPGLSDAMPVTQQSSSSETTSLVDVSIQQTGGRAQMKLQKALIGGLGVNGKANGNLDGIGDEAFAISNNLLLVRKGDMFIQFAFTNCPCAAAQIEPLAKKLVDAL